MKKRFTVKTEVPILFADCDPMGHCNNARFFSFMEFGRVQYYKKIKKLDIRDMHAKSEFAFILASERCDFKSPAFVDERLVIALRTSRIGTKSLTMEYEIREKKSGRLVATAESVQVMYNYKKNMSLVIPDNLKKEIEKFEGGKL